MELNEEDVEVLDKILGLLLDGSVNSARLVKENIAIDKKDALNKMDALHQYISTFCGNASTKYSASDDRYLFMSDDKTNKFAKSGGFKSLYNLQQLRNDKSQRAGVKTSRYNAKMLWIGIVSTLIAALALVGEDKIRLLYRWLVGFF